MDAEERNNWVAELEVDLAQTREAAEPVLCLVKRPDWFKTEPVRSASATR